MIKIINSKHLTFSLSLFFILMLFSCSQEEITDEIIMEEVREEPLNQKIAPSRFQYFYRGRSGRKNTIYTSYSTNGTVNWAGDSRIGSNSEIKTSPIDATTFFGRVFLAHKGASTDKIFFTYSDNGNNFSRNKSLPNGARMSQKISLISFKRKLFIYHNAPSSSNSIYWNYTTSSSGSSWSNNQRINDNTSYVDFDFVVSDSSVPLIEKLFLVGLTTSGITIKSSTNGTDFTTVSEINVPTLTTAPKFISVARFGNSYYVLIQSGSNNTPLLSIMRSDDNFQSFTSQNPLRVVANNNGSTVLTSNSQASIASDGNRLVITYQAANSTDIYSLHSANGVLWNGGRARGATKNSGVALIHTKE